MNIHNIKSYRKFYELVVTKQEKTFEVRKHDRSYEVGDLVIFWEVTNKGEYTGIKSKPFVIDFLLTYEDFPQGIQPGYCVFSVTPHAVYEMCRK